MNDRSSVPDYPRGNPHISREKLQYWKLSQNDGKRASPRAYHTGSGGDSSTNQMLIQQHYPRLTIGKFKGYNDCRRSRCYRRECRYKNLESCSYCSHLPYFPSPLRQCYYPRDFQTFDFVQINSDSDSDMDSDSTIAHGGDNRKFPVEIKLNYLLTEINELIITNENQELKSSSSLPKKSESGTFGNRSNPLTSLSPIATTSDVKSSRSTEFWEKLGLWRSKK